MDHRTENQPSHRSDSDVMQITVSDADSNDNDPVTRKNYEKRLTSAIVGGLAFASFTCVAMIAGSLIVCLTYSEPAESCKNMFERTVKNSVTRDPLPRSVALGDVNGDGRLDIIVANAGSDTIGIFIGQNNATFADQISYPTGPNSRPYSLVVGDVNNDGRLDLAVANYGVNSIGIMLGRTKGTFTDMLTLSTGSARPFYIAVGDFNNDKNLDLAVVNYGTHDIGLHLGYGNGTFAGERRYSMGYDSVPHSLVVGDFNNDKNVDLAVVNYGVDNLIVLFGTGNGTFSSSTAYSTGYGSRPSSIAIADIDHDHRWDLIVANDGTHSIGIFYGHANGTFEQQRLFPLADSSSPQFVVTGDMNSDNHTDIVILDSITGDIHVLRGFGNRSFWNLSTLMTDGELVPIGAVVGDLNENGRDDIVVVSNGENRILVLIDYIAAFSVTQNRYLFSRNSHSPSVALADFNSDRRLDVAVARLNDDQLSIVLGYGNGSFQAQRAYRLPPGSAPRCVATGDFNNDGAVDLVVANYRAHTIGVLLGHRNGSLEDVVTYRTGVEAFPIFVAVGDFNNDSVLDIAAANLRIDNVAIFIGYGDGSFADAVPYSTGEGSDPSAIVVADFNDDRLLDLAIANSERGNVGLLFGNGDGSFKAVKTFSTGVRSHPDSIVAGRINADPWLDIVVADSTSDNVILLFGKANGTFEKPFSYSDETFSGPSGLALADVDNDDFLDIIVTNFDSDNVGVLSRATNGSLTLIQSYSLLSGAGPRGVVVGDFNNNTRWDIVVAESGFGSFNLLVRYISADFDREITYSTGHGAHPSGVALGDFDNDRRLDIAVANSASDTIGVSLGHGDGTFAAEKTYHVGLDAYPQSIVVGDFDQDNQTDIAAVNTFNDSIVVLSGLGNGSFAQLDKYALRSGDKPYSLAVDDFNHDQKWDFAVASKGTDNVAIMFGYTYMSFQDQQTYSSNESTKPSSITIQDFNGDQHLDITATFAATDSIGLLFGNGSGSFSELVTYAVGVHSYPYEIIATDVNNDNVWDLIVANTGSSTLGVFIGYGNGTFAPVLLFSTGEDSQPYGAAAGDLNNDKRVDVVVANYHGNSIGVLLGYGNGSFSAVTTYSTTDGSRPQSVALGDFNDDAVLDVVVANYLRDNMAIFIGNGDGTFRDGAFYSTGYLSSPTFINVHDYNNDNRLDVAVSNKNNDNVGILYGFGNGTLASVISHSTGEGSSPHSIRSGDFDNDKRIDVAIVCPGTNSVVILYGSENDQFLLGPSYSTGSKSGPISLAIGDLDGNSRLDIATANYLMSTVGVHLSHGTRRFGGVTRYSTGYGSQPYSVAVADFDRDGNPDIVAANYGTSSVGILLGHGDGSFSTMVRYLLMADARPVALAIDDIDRDRNVDILVVDSALSNIYFFLGVGDGTFVWKHTYSTNPTSYPYGIALGDFNSDRIQDIVAVTIGTNEVLILQGYGNGTFGNKTSQALGYSSVPLSVAVGDFNRDNQLDVAVASYGSNYVDVLLRSC